MALAFLPHPFNVFIFVRVRRKVCLYFLIRTDQSDAVDVNLSIGEAFRQNTFVLISPEISDSQSKF
jgi:hypothetical protein